MAQLEGGQRQVGWLVGRDVVPRSEGGASWSSHTYDFVEPRAGPCLTASCSSGCNPSCSVFNTKEREVQRYTRPKSGLRGIGRAVWQPSGELAGLLLDLAHVAVNPGPILLLLSGFRQRFYTLAILSGKLAGPLPLTSSLVRLP